MSEHTESHGHGEGHEHHSHAKTYWTVGAILFVVTVIELVILPDISSVAGFVLPAAVINWSLVLLSIFKLFFVIGVFMHLKDDRQIYSLLFVSPMIIAIIMITVLAAMAIGHYSWTAKEYPQTLINVGDVVPPPDYTLEEFQAKYKEAAASNYSAGQAVFSVQCAGCHKANGGGLVGPNLTDNCYLHGGDLKSIEHVLINGVTQKGMPAWRNVITDQELIDVAMYVRSMRGQNVEGGKECQGEPAK